MMPSAYGERFATSINDDDVSAVSANAIGGPQVEAVDPGDDARRLRGSLAPQVFVNHNVGTLLSVSLQVPS